MSSDPTPVTALADREVYAADGARVGRVVDVVVDLGANRAVALALGDVAERTVGALPADASGVRVPVRLVRGVGDAVVLSVDAGGAALPLPGSRADDGAVAATGEPAADDDRPAGAVDGDDAGGDGDPIV